MKKIFITSYHSFISRNIFNSDVLKILKSKDDLKIIIFAPTHKKEFLERYYGGNNVIIEGLDLDEIVRSKFNKFWHRLSFLMQNTQYVKDQRKDYLFKNKNIFRYINYFFLEFLSKILSKPKFLQSIYRFLEFIFSPKDIFRNYIDKYKPTVIFSTDIFSESDVLLLREAKAKKIPTIGMVRSWDNTTTKGILRVFPDRILVNSPTIKEQLIKLHSCKEEDIFIVGLPQFDSWLNGPTLRREEFFKKIKANPNKRLILFAPAGRILSDTDWQICQILKYAIRKNKLPSDIQFLVRNHPTHPADLSKFDQDENFIIENPGVKFKEGEKETEISPDDQTHLLNSIYYSEIIMFIATSLGLDATVFDKPQIIISFDGYEKKPYIKSVKRYHNEDNLKQFIACNGAKVVENAKELIYWINRYLENPKIDQEGRKKILEHHLYKLDGKAGERIANFILDSISPN